jgi:beta-lactamase class A
MHATRIRRAYRRQTARAGGVWRSLVTVGDAVAVAERADEVVLAASVNKLAVACAVLSKVDTGLLRLDSTVALTPDLVLGGSGIYHLQPAVGDQLTLGGVLTALLLVSDNTAVRLCGLVCPGPEVNAYLAAHGFTHTRVAPVPDRPERMFLGTTTAREAHGLLRALVAGRLVGPASTRFLLDVLRSTSGFHDGVRRSLSSDERRRVAAKQGTDDDHRHEVGVVFDGAGAPAVVFAFLATLPDHGHDHGGTHPLVRARAALGPVLVRSN